MQNIRPLIPLLALITGCAGSANTGGNPSLTMPRDAIVARLDSLAATSHGDYLHIYIGPCLGRCEAYVSIFRESAADFHIYEAEGWRYNEFQREDILYRLRHPITSQVAEDIFRRASEIGIFDLVEDRTQVVPDHPTIWLRARIGGRTIVLNDVNLGGASYAGAGKEGGRYATYVDLRQLLLAELFGMRVEDTSGR